MTSIYFPVRSNVHYWDTKPLDLDLKSRLKLAALLYDELVFDDGTYTALIGPDLSLELVESEWHADPEIPPWPREDGEFAVEFVTESGTVSLASKALRRYRLSLRGLLEGHGLAGLSWVSFSQAEFSKAASASLKEMAERDIHILDNGDSETYLLRKHMLHGITRDWVMASLMGWDLVLDPIHQSLYRQKIAHVEEEMQTSRPAVEFEVIFTRLPDLTSVPWDQVLDAREHPSAVSFRAALAGVTDEARQAFLAGESADGVRYQVSKWRDEQLLDELEARLSTPKSTLKDIGLSLVLSIGSALPPIGPFVALADALRDVIGPARKLLRERKSLAAAFVRRRPC